MGLVPLNTASGRTKRRSLSFEGFHDVTQAPNRYTSAVEVVDVSLTIGIPPFPSSVWTAVEREEDMLLTTPILPLLRRGREEDCVGIRDWKAKLAVEIIR